MSLGVVFVVSETVENHQMHILLITSSGNRNFVDMLARSLLSSTLSPCCRPNLYLLLLETVLPDSDVRRDTVLTVVEEDDPARYVSHCKPEYSRYSNTHIPSGFIDSPIRNS